MAYEDCDKAAMGSLLLFETDGVSQRFLIVGEPVVQKDRSQWGIRTRYLFPVLFDGELRALPVGVRVYKNIRDSVDSLPDHAVLMTRHGKRKSIDTTYVVEIIAQSEAEGLSRESVKDADIAALWDDMLIPF